MASDGNTDDARGDVRQVEVKVPGDIANLCPIGWIVSIKMLFFGVDFTPNRVTALRMLLISVDVRCFSYGSPGQECSKSSVST